MTSEASLAEIEEMVRAARADLPPPFQTAACDVIVRVVERPDERLLRDVGLADPLELTGLYEGIPLTEKSVNDPAPVPDVIWLFRAPILAERRERGNVTLRALVTHVFIHELAHHFGWSDADIAAIDPWWE